MMAGVARVFRSRGAGSYLGNAGTVEGSICSLRKLPCRQWEAIYVDSVLGTNLRGV